MFLVSIVVIHVGLNMCEMSVMDLTQVIISSTKNTMQVKIKKDVPK